MPERIRIAKLQHGSFAEGPRRNTTLWVAGCALRCPGCFNPELWDPQAGRPVAIDILLDMISRGITAGNQGLAVVGGEPFDQPDELMLLLAGFKARYPQLPVTVYSGYRIETLLRRQASRLTLDLADVLVDGRFDAEQAKDDLGFRGSANQRIIDLVRSRRTEYQELVRLRWDGLIAFLPDGSLTGSIDTLDLLGAEDEAECGRYDSA